MKKRKNVIIPLRRSAIMPEGLYYINHRNITE